VGRDGILGDALSGWGAFLVLVTPECGARLLRGASGKSRAHYEDHEFEKLSVYIWESTPNLRAYY
jgi:hypothetical protein